MADSDAILAALLGTGGAGLDPLSNFQKATASNDILKMAAAPVLQAKFDNSTWSPLQTFGTSAAQAFLGTLLHGLGQRQEDEQLMKVAAVYPQLAKDPLSVAVPEGVDSTAFNALKLGQLQKNAALESAREQKKQDLKDALLLKFADKPYSPGGKAALSALGLDSVVGDVFSKNQSEFEKALEQTGGDEALARDLVKAKDPTFLEAKLREDTALKQNAAKIENSDASLTDTMDFFKRQFEDAKNVKTLSAWNPLSPDWSALDSINNNISVRLQQAIKREMSGPALAAFQASLPSSTDTKEQIDAKEARFMQLVQDAIKAPTATLPQVGEGALAASPVSRISREELVAEARKLLALGFNKDEIEATLKANFGG